MKKIIIGIHGLKNKPAKQISEKWWKSSILDGLQRYGSEIQDFQFELVYWADLEYENPLDPKITDPDDPLYIENPYVPSSYISNPEATKDIKKKLFNKIENGLDKLFLKNSNIGGIEKIVDTTLKHMFMDLDAYYNGHCKVKKDLVARSAFRKRLADILKKHRNKQILLIGHSMGSIIAYDTLTQDIPKFKIDTFITIGSPLGFSLIIKKILLEQNKEINPEAKADTPDNIISDWFNFADLDDKITMNYNLANDFLFSKRKVKPVDIIINNHYEYKGEKNPHKAYGYMQNEKFAEVIEMFLKKKTSYFSKFLEKIKR
ncbi:MAG: GPI inositol-deacylase [Candidatus Cloacimonetes bacterium]|nr:GPI inositol-deacylase [Candidatus Cloacimonadota bacterium]